MNIEITNQQEFDNRPLLPIEIKNQWIEALRSGKYQQGKFRLNRDSKFCCLGVLCEIEGLEKTEIPSTTDNTINVSYGNDFLAGLPNSSLVYNVLSGLGNFKGFEINKKECLAFLNDDGMTFEEIAEVIEKYF